MPRAAARLDGERAVAEALRHAIWSQMVSSGGSVPMVVDAATVRRLTPMPALIAALRAAFAGDVVAPQRHSHPMGPGRTLLMMPAWGAASGRFGVKVTSVDAQRLPSIQAAYLLLDGVTGATLALLDGAMLTARRTAATSALAAGYLARAEAGTLMMLGTGVLAPHMVEAHASVRPIRRVLCWGRDGARAAALAKDLRRTGLEAEAVPAIDAAIGSADLISAATGATTPLVHGARLAAGTHVDLVGSYKPGMREADTAALQRARVFVDTREGTLAEAGELLQAMADGAWSAADIAGDLRELCTGAVAGRGDADGITLFKSVGTGLADLAAAEMVFNAWMQE